MLGEEFEYGQGHVIESELVSPAVWVGGLRQMCQVWNHESTLLSLFKISAGCGISPMESSDGPPA